jgi:hypothetical protein
MMSSQKKNRITKVVREEILSPLVIVRRLLIRGELQWALFSRSTRDPFLYPYGGYLP